MEWHSRRAAYPAYAALSCVCYGRTKGTARIDLGSGTSNGGVIFHACWPVSDYPYGPRACSEPNAV